MKFKTTEGKPKTGHRNFRAAFWAVTIAYFVTMFGPGITDQSTQFFLYYIIAVGVCFGFFQAKDFLNTRSFFQAKNGNGGEVKENGST